MNICCVAFKKRSRSKSLKSKEFSCICVGGWHEAWAKRRTLTEEAAAKLLKLKPPLRRYAPEDPKGSYRSGKRRRIELTNDRVLLLPLVSWQERRNYGEFGPVTLFGASVAERSRRYVVSSARPGGDLRN